MDDLGEAGQGGDDVLDLFAAESLARGVLLAQAGFGERLLGLDLADPLGDDCGVGAGVERGAVVGEFPVGLGQGPGVG
ncbi:hypothetical protein [Micromonospora sp. DT47]|uniref:hypothetical protein n=1 Tax=Micromonospora sp. DT47 TaxID=3393431 RepID=UPI003CEDD25A